MNRKISSLFLLLALVLAACGQGTASPEAHDISQQTEPAQPVAGLVPDNAAELCEASFSAPTSSSSVIAPIRTLTKVEYDTAAWDFDPNIMAVPHVEPMRAAEIQTLLCIKESREQTVTYPDNVNGYRLLWDARLVSYPSGDLLASSQFAGEQPPDADSYETMKDYFEGAAYGDRPSPALLEWLYPLLGDKSILGHGAPIFTLALLPDGNTLASAGSSPAVKFWDMATGKLLRTLSPGEDVSFVEALAFSPDGKMLALPGKYPTAIQLLDANTGGLLRELTSEEDFFIHSLVFSPDGKTLNSGNWDGLLHQWDVVSGGLLRTLTGHTDLVQVLAVSPDGQTLASAGLDGQLILWDLASGALLRQVDAHAGGIDSLAFSPDGKLVATGSDDGTAKIWDVSTGQVVQAIEADDSVTSLAFSPDGKLLALSDVTDIKLYDTATWEVLRQLVGHHQSVRGLVFLPDGRTLISGSTDSTVKLWHLSANR